MKIHYEFARATLLGLSAMMMIGCASTDTPVKPQGGISTTSASSPGKKAKTKWEEGVERRERKWKAWTLERRERRDRWHDSWKAN